MKNSKYKRITLIAVFVFFMTVPFLQSIFFSNTIGGVMKVNKKIQADYIDSDKKVLLLFFGYFGCKEVCTPVLHELSNLYESEEFKDIKSSVDIFFINLTPEVEEHQPNLFAKYFNKDFKGIYLSRKNVLNIDRNFDVFFASSLNDQAELNHTDHIYLLQNNLDSKILKYIYSTHPLKTKKLIHDIIQINIKSLEEMNEKYN
ncbi:SCO family protein [bacterium]|nr:SCO family protein [bacterium]MBU1994545.1 SCO family protein [bacterium]